MLSSSTRNTQTIDNAHELAMLISKCIYSINMSHSSFNSRRVQCSSSRFQPPAGGGGGDEPHMVSAPIYDLGGITVAPSANRGPLSGNQWSYRRWPCAEAITIELSACRSAAAATCQPHTERPLTISQSTQDTQQRPSACFQQTLWRPLSSTGYVFRFFSKKNYEYQFQ